MRVAAEAAADKLADDIIAYDVSEQLVITDAFLLCSAPNDRQVRAIVDEIEERMRVRADAKPVRREGEREGRWVLLDYVDVVVHVQHEEDRAFYALERLWKDCPVDPAPRDRRRSSRRSGRAAERAREPGGWSAGGTVRPGGTSSTASRGTPTSSSMRPVWRRPRGPRRCSPR